MAKIPSRHSPIPPIPPIPPPEASGNGSVIKACDFQVINFHDARAALPDGTLGREIILLYALGEDGVVREFSNGQWTPLPIHD